MATIKTQGTALYFKNTTEDPAVVTKLDCPTGITGLGGAADQIETTCLDATEDKTYVRGLGNPGQVNVPFNLDPTAASHHALFDLKATGELVNWMVCLAESTTAPTLVAGVLTAPADRSALAFTAYVADVTIDVATNEVVKGTLILQRSGVVTPSWYTPV